MQLQRLWERGSLLSARVREPLFAPIRLRLKSPNSGEITEHFRAVSAWAQELANAPYLRLEWQQLNHRVHGPQQLPSEVWIDHFDDVLEWLGTGAQWQQFSALLELTGQRHPELLTWIEKQPMQALALAPQWPRLLAVIDWLVVRPRPGVYLRQVDLTGVHSKFVEAHRGVLSELLDLVLPAQAIDQRVSGAQNFAARYGFTERPTRIRFRALDPDLSLLPGTRCPDIKLDVESFARLELTPRRIFITENEINYLAFPARPQSIVLFGAGYGWEALARCAWLHRHPIYYWGDIDTHGFGILDQLRGHFGAVQSFLMDRATLMAHRDLWGAEDKPLRAKLSRLNSDELALYQALRDDEIAVGLRLEQEHIGYGWLLAHLPD